MNTGLLKNGTKIHIVRTDHFVKARDFINALAENFYTKGEDFPDKITKKEAEKILRHRLFFHGIHGEIEHGYFEASFEEGECFNAIFDKAREFVLIKYPFYDNIF